MNKWGQITNEKNRFRLFCDHEECTSSVLNIINGIISVSSMHNGQRHTSLLSHQDMLFVVSQYLNSLSKKERDKVMEFFQNF